MLYYNEKMMKQLKKMLKKEEKLRAQQMDELTKNNLSPNSGKGSSKLVTQTSTYTDQMRIQQLKQQTHIHALGYVGGMLLAVAYKYVLAAYEKRYGVGYYGNNNDRKNRNMYRKNSSNNAGNNNNNNGNDLTIGIGNALDTNSPISHDKPNHHVLLHNYQYGKRKQDMV